MSRSFGPRTLTKRDHELRLEQYLHQARDEAILTTPVATVQSWYSALDPRFVEAKFLARQDAVRRRADG